MLSTDHYYKYKVEKFYNNNEKVVKSMKTIEIPIWEKQNLTVSEAASYSGIGINKIYALTESPTCDFVLKIGNKRLIKRKRFDKYIENISEI